MDKIKASAVLIILLFAAGAQCGESSDFQVARSAYEDGLYQISAGQFVQFISRHPKSTRIHEAYFYLGECKFNLKDYQDALSAYAAAAVSPEFRERALYKTAKAHLKAGDTGKAVSSFNKYLSAFPEGEFADASMYWMGESLCRKNSFQEARRAFLSVRGKNPSSPYLESALYASGICSLKINDFSAAAASLSDLLASSPSTKFAPEAHYWLGHALMKTGAPDRSLASFSRVFSEYPEAELADEALYHSGLLLFNLGEYSRAVELLAGLAGKFPGSRLRGQADFLLGLSSEKLGDIDSAIKHYEAVETDKPSTLELRAMYRKGKCLMSAGRKEDAAAVFENIAEAYPGTPESRLSSLRKAILLYGRGEYGAAAGAAETLLEPGAAEAPMPAALFTAGASRLAGGEFEKAMEAYGSIISGDHPGRWREKGMFYLAACLMGGGRFREAAGAFSEFSVEFPESGLYPQAVFAAAESFFRSGEYAMAENYYQKSAPHPEFRDISLIRTGDCQLLLGRTDEALKNYGMVEGPLAPEAKIKTARTLYSGGAFSAAEEAASALLKSRTRFLDQAQFIVAGAALHSGNFEKAEKEFTFFIEQFPGSNLLPSAFLSLGIAWYRMGNFERAQNFFEKTAALFPEEPEAADSRFWSAACLQNIGRANQAALKLNEYLNLHPEGTHAEEARLRLGRYYYAAGEIEKAEGMLSTLLKSEDRRTRTDSSYWMGHIFSAKNELGKAHEMFREVADSEDDMNRVAEALLRIGGLFGQQQKHREAERIYQKILREHSGNITLAEVYYALGASLQSLNRHREALGAFSSIELPHSEAMEAGIQLRTADSYAALGMREEALLEYLKLAYLYPAQTNMVLGGLEAAAGILESTGRAEEAAKLYRRIAGMDPDGIKGEAAVRKLSEITR